jgi:Asp-tRNA(Asn)/Glu-tRNA(Gln) amidotransferase A subunit family amidase
MTDLPRRRFIAELTGAGAAAPALLFPGVVWAKVQQAGGGDVTPEIIMDAARVAGLEVTQAQAEAMVEKVEENFARYREVQNAPLGNEVPLPLHFDPRVTGVTVDRTPTPIRMTTSNAERPADLEEAAFWPITDLAHLLSTRQVTSLELTDMYLGRLKRHGPALNCVVTLTEERARAKAMEADEDIAAGRYRGPVHGIPYGVKDIIAVRGYPTTWGAARFADRVIDEDATVIQRLDAAGAVLVAKLTTGELAFGDRWFRGRTNSPWNPEVGSSGSSAGSGAATAAGLVGFSIGTDTGGSILAPSERCGIVGLRPTFGRVSRYGVMAAGTTLDKVGPMCRSAEGAALVLHAIAGPDDRDLSVPDIPVHWNSEMDVTRLRLGYLERAFEEEEDPEYREHHVRVLQIFRARWGELRPVTLPANNINFFVEFVERAAGFDELLRDGLETQLVRPNHATELRAYHLVPAVAYLQANRLRQRLMEETHQALSDVDVVLSPHGVWWHPSRGLNAIMSLTGHPSVSVPTGLRSNGQPFGVTLAGHLYREGELLAIAQRLLEAMGFQEKRPPLFS